MRTTRSERRLVSVAALALVAAALVLPMGLRSCTSPPPVSRPGSELVRRGDEIVVCGRLFHTGATVVLWTDPGGYDAYRTERRFVREDEAPWSPDSGPPTPNRYGRRAMAGDPGRLVELREHVDQFVIHYDAAGTSRQCFKVLHDLRGLSVHFMIDIDGTIYQTLDLKERAWHATKANDRSIGVEIAHIGAYPLRGEHPLDQWYAMDEAGARLTVPAWQGDGGIRTEGFIGRPARAGLLVGDVHGRRFMQRDFTPQQYESLTRLTATLCEIFPRLSCEFPRGPGGAPLDRAMSDAEFDAYRGLLGHLHVQENKIDPGPAFDWERVVRGAKALRE